MPVSGFKDNSFVITIAQKPLAVSFRRSILTIAIIIRHLGECRNNIADKIRLFRRRLANPIGMRNFFGESEEIAFASVYRQSSYNNAPRPTPIVFAGRKFEIRKGWAVSRRKIPASPYERQ